MLSSSPRRPLHVKIGWRQSRRRSILDLKMMRTPDEADRAEKLRSAVCLGGVHTGSDAQPDAGKCCGCGTSYAEGRDSFAAMCTAHCKAGALQLMTLQMLSGVTSEFCQSCHGYICQMCTIGLQKSAMDVEDEGSVECPGCCAPIRVVKAVSGRNLVNEAKQYVFLETDGDLGVPSAKRVLQASKPCRVHGPTGRGTVAAFDALAALWHLRRLDPESVAHISAEEEAGIVRSVHTVAQSCILDEHPPVSTPEAEELDSWWSSVVDA